MTLWGGRFSGNQSEALASLSRSVQFDWRLAPYEIRVNAAHLTNLRDIGAINSADFERLHEALRELYRNITSGEFTPNSEDEDVHSAIERGLREELGDLGGALRAGRSRNDLVVTDFKLYLIEHLLLVAREIAVLEEALLDQADSLSSVIAPGFTHLQHAQPILFSHELLKHVHSLQRDVSRIHDWFQRNRISPFGAGALAGSAMQPLPERTAELLGFIGVNGNSIDAVSDRDFVTEALFILATIGVHLSRIGEEFSLWASTEFGWVRLDDAYSTGSSIMPQKKNPDVAELARGKSGRVIGNLVSVLVVLKGLPFAYNRDLQEDKEPVFDSIETLLLLLPALAGMISTSEFDRQAIESRVTEGFTLATEIADYLAIRQVPFSIAHEIAGKCVKYCESHNCELHEIPTNQLTAIHPLLTEDLFVHLSSQGAVSSRGSVMGTAPASVRKQMALLRGSLHKEREWTSYETKAFSGMMAL
jgi:argininosuccinate lyase